MKTDAIGENDKNSSNDYAKGIINGNDMQEANNKSWCDIESQYWRSVYVGDYWENDSEEALTEFQDH